jgi:hypothetical protein
MAKDEDVVVAYEDRTFLTGRTTYRDLATGKKVDPDEVVQVVSVAPPPLSWYLGFSRRR